MLTEPKVEHRTKQPYAAIRTKVSMKDIPSVLPPLIPEMFGWLAKNNITPQGPPFFQYLTIDKDNQLEVAVGIPVQNAVTGNGRVVEGAFPAGTYATVTHIGNYSHLREAHMALDSWLDNNGWKDKRQATDQGMQYGSRTEFYPSDPKVVTNPDKWESEIAILLAED
jgi:effector-binding domain-containing protein